MSQGRPAAAAIEPSRTPDEGWHCTHFYYRFERAVLHRLSNDQRMIGRSELVDILGSDAAQSPQSPQRLQTFFVSGHKADFGIMVMDPDPLKVEAVNQRILASVLGAALESPYSFVSLSEISEYVPTVQQYAERLIEEGEQEGSESFQAKVNAYRRREPIMRKQRLTPDFPTWPVMCFYPMNKKRKVGENWYMLPFAERSRMMSEHARSGMEFAGKVTQLITVGVGLDDWEWGVTLWAANPQFLTRIVYRMRFDEASARYAEFGPFYTGYILPPEEVIGRCLP